VFLVIGVPLCGVPAPHSTSPVCAPSTQSVDDTTGGDIQDQYRDALGGDAITQGGGAEHIKQVSPVCIWDGVVEPSRINRNEAPSSGKQPWSSTAKARHWQYDSCRNVNGERSREK
jgi:hypothetical protein